MSGIFKSVEKGRLYSYAINGDLVAILAPDGSTVINSRNNPNGGVWDDTAKSEWAINIMNNYNSRLVKKMYDDKLTALNAIYLEANLGRVTLTDGHVFSASYQIGENPSKSLSNTRTLIRDAAELAVYKKQPSVTLSDADNNDVVYEIKYTNGVGDFYILPVVEIGSYEGLFFELKRTIRNELMEICNDNMLSSNTSIDVDALYSFDPVSLFNSRRAAYEEEAYNKANPVETVTE